MVLIASVPGQCLNGNGNFRLLTFHLGAKSLIFHAFRTKNHCLSSVNFKIYQLSKRCIALYWLFKF